MCHLCVEHAGRDEKWYERYENYLFNKVFPTPEEQAEAKKAMVATFAETEWRYAEPDYIRNPQYLAARAATRFGGQMVTMEETLRILKIADEATKREDSMVVIGHCPCRLVYDGTRDYVCIGFGMPVTMSMEIGYGRLPKQGLTEFGGAEWSDIRKQVRQGVKVPLKYSEAEELLREWEKKGLFHLIMGRGRLPLIEAICNCERLHCTYWRNRDVYGLKDYCLKGHFVARIDPLNCTNCEACRIECQFGAIHTSRLSNTTVIEPQKCFGCGLCRIACKVDAIEMVPRNLVPAAKDLW